MKIKTEGGWLALLVVSMLTVTVMASDTDQIVEGSTRFSLDLMKEVFKQTSGNAVMSPFTVSTLLAMLQQGAHNISATELQTVLHLKKDVALRGYQSFISDIKKRESSSEFEFGNSMFANQDFDLVPEYKDAIEQSFHAVVESIDFRHPTAAAKKINKWVSRATRDKITEIVKPETISGRTELVLVNAIYFKGRWLRVFKVEETHRAPFLKADGKQVTVDMMTFKNMKLKANEDLQNLNAKWIELLYYDYDYSMVLVLPNGNDTLDTLIDRMSYSNFADMMNTRTSRQVTLHLPKFKLRTDKSLVSVMQTLGLKSVFNQNSNLEGISSTKTPLVVSDILHKAFLEVNEYGSVATATSGIVVNTLSISPPILEMDFNANRPFLAFIVDKTTLLPIFVAKITDPTTT